MQTKKCSCCEHNYPATFEYFNKDIGKKDNLHSYCKECHRDQSKAYSKSHPKSKEINHRDNQKRIVQSRKIMTEIKSNGCAICGYNQCESSLSFHHTNPEDKTRRIDYATLGCSNSNITHELNKCILLCTNCHGELHEKERGLQ